MSSLSLELSAIRSEIASVASVKDKKSIIDEAIAKHHEHLCSLKTLRNGIAWITSLPEEIFHQDHDHCRAA